MVSRRSRSGMTLVEVIMTVAIASMLGFLLLAGQRGLREEAEFGAAMDLVKNRFVSVKNAVASPRNDSGSATPGRTIGTILFGKVIELNNGDTQLRVSSILASDTSSTANMTVQDTYTIDFPAELRYTGPQRNVVFVRSKDDGRLLAYTPSAGQITNQGYYTAGNRVSTLSLPFIGKEGRTGTIEINALAGEITRTVR